MNGATQPAARDDAPAGIADHRDSYPDPQLSRAEDAEIARRLEQLAPERELEELLNEHWRLVGKRPELAARFTARELTAAAQVEPVVAAIEAALGRRIGPDDRVLEVGCGTAALSAALAARGAEVVASDVSLRWLVLARKRLAESNVELVACAAEALPFEPGSFDVVAATDVIEHVADPGRFVAEAARVLRPGGLLFLSTPNRYSLGLEPHVRLWGVGYLPRPLAERYVQTARKSSYSHVHLLSARGLERLLRESGLEPEIVTPAVPDATRKLYSGSELKLVDAYNRALTLAPARAVLRAVGPFFHVFGRKPA